MTPNEQLLDQYLGLHYHAAVLGKGSPSDVVASFKDKLEKIGGLRELAQLKIQQLETFATTVGDLEKRCAISAQQLSCLRQALNP